MKLNGHFYFTKGQLTTMLKGKEVRFRREGNWIIGGLKKKQKMVEIEKLQRKIEALQQQLKEKTL